MNKRKLIGNLAMFFAAAFFGLNVPISKFLLEAGVRPMGLLGMRVCFAFAAFWIVSFFLPREHVDRRDLRRIMLGGVLGMALNTTFFITGLSYTSPIDSSIIATLAPVFVMIMAAFMLKEPISGKKISGVMLGAIGAILIILLANTGVVRTGDNPVFGNLLTLIGSLAYGTYLVVVRDVVSKYRPITFMKWTFTSAILFVLPFSYHDIIASIEVLTFENVMEWAGIGYALFFSTFLSFLLVSFAQQRIRPTTVSAYNYMQPFVASLASILVGQSVLKWIHPLSALLIFAGVYLITTSKAKGEK